jgi:glycosyltransferase involved in cell wall biosynthesis
MEICSTIWKLKVWFREKRSTVKSSRSQTSPKPVSAPSLAQNYQANQIDLPFPINSENAVFLIAYQFFNYSGTQIYLGGAERYLVELSRIIRAQGYSPIVIQSGSANWLRYYQQIQVIGLDAQGNQEKFEDLIPRLNLKGRLLIYSPFSIATKKAGLPSIGISHGIFWDHPYLPIGKDVLNDHLTASLHNNDQIISVDTATINWIRTFDFPSADHCHYIPNFVDLNEFHPSLEAENEGLVILYPRRLCKERGFYLLVEIIPQILTKYPNIQFHFVGKGDLAEETTMQELIAQYPQRIVWYSLPMDRMPEAYQKAVITVIPTLHSEGTSLSCLEAMASGHTIIATHVGGLSNLILDHYNGLLIEPNQTALLEALEELIHDPQLRKQLAEKNLQIAPLFSLTAWQHKWQKVLSGLLAQKLPIDSLVQNKKIIFPYAWGIHWEGVQQRPHHLAKIFARSGYEIFWYTPEGHKPDPLPNIHLIARNDYLLFERPVLFIYYPQSFEDISKFNDPIIVYDVLDDISIHDNPDNNNGKIAREYHEQLLLKADIVIVSSRILLEQIRTRRPDAIYVPNAVDLEHFNPAAVQPISIFDNLGKPIIGYHGAIADWFDGDLLAATAKLRPQYVFVLIGPVSNDRVQQKLNTQSNIRCLGMIPYDQLPPYIARFDVGILPFVLSPLTHAVRPLKILEYLAMQKQVVTTSMKEILDWPGLYLADTAQEFAKSIDHALDNCQNHENSPEVVKLLENSTWSGVAQTLLQALEKQYH